MSKAPFKKMTQEKSPRTFTCKQAWCNIKTMSGRDLLYKPPLPTPLSEETSESSKSQKTKKSREIGRVPGIDFSKKPSTKKSSTPNKTQSAYKAAYFNKDTSGVGEANMGTNKLQALRGSENATDLKKIVLPPALGIDNPNPEILRQVCQRMGVNQGEGLDLQSLIQRQNTWLKNKNTTADIIEQRKRELEAMVEARKVALIRMQKKKSTPLQDETLQRAVQSRSIKPQQDTDLVDTSRHLIKRTGEQAEGMHFRIAKMLGIKITPPA